MIMTFNNTGITKHEFLPQWVAGCCWLVLYFKSEDFPTLRIKSTTYLEKEQVHLQT